MKKLLFKSIPVIILLYIVCVFWQGIIDKGLHRSAEYGPKFFDWDSIYNGGIDADIVVMGSSRAGIIIDPKLITDSFNRSCYNIGIDGHKFVTQYYRYQLYRQHNKPPKTILLCLDLFSLIHTKRFYDYEQFIPYLNDTIIRNIVKPFDIFTWKDLYIPMVKFTHRKDMILDGTIAYFKPADIKNSKVRGFGSVDLPWDTAFVRSVQDIILADGYSVKIDSQTNRLFLDFINYCHINKIKLLFIFPPEYSGYFDVVTNRKFVMNYYDSISKINNIPFFNYMNFPPISPDTSLFFDSQHMNTKGVKVFGKQLIKDIKKSM